MHVRLNSFVYGIHIAGYEEIGPAIIVIIEKPSREAEHRALYTSLATHLGEGFVTVVVIKEIHAIVVRNVEINKTITVIVSCRHTFVERSTVDTRCMTNFLERPIAPVMKQLRRAVFVSDEQVEIAIIVDIRPHRRLSGSDTCAQ